MRSNNLHLVNPQFDGESFILQGSSTAVLLFHGFTATTLEVKGLADYIHQNAGFSVYAPLLPGHGTSPVDLNQTSHKDWIYAAQKAYQELEDNYEQIFLGGESMGALLALYIAAKFPLIGKLALFSPALIIPGLFKAKLLKWLVFGSPKKNVEAPTSDGNLPWQGYRVNPLRAVVELGKLQELILPVLSSITQPTIIFQGCKDETIDPRGSKIIFQNISSQLKNFIDLKESGHCVLLENERKHVFKTVADFFQQKV